jgi:hypothetical protein
MCYLITIVIPAAATAILKQQSQALLTEDIVLLPTFNPSITQYFRDDMSAFAIIRGTCSCDLYTGRAASPIEKRRQKYKTKGWSEAKIQRALAGKVNRGQRCYEPI